MTYTITNNTAFKSIEIAFDGKPSEAVRDALKALRFRWHSVKKIWYGYADEATAREAIDTAENGSVKAEKAPKTAVKAEAVNEYGVKVGDVFTASWGYEQTNVNFFQVIELVGKKSVKLIEVCPEMIGEDAVSGMSANRTYNLTEKIMPRKSWSHLKDNENGTLKRVSKSGYDGGLYIHIDDVITAYKAEHGACKTYESWYY